DFFACISFGHHTALSGERRQMKGLYDFFRRQIFCLRKSVLSDCHIIVFLYHKFHPALSANGCIWRRRSEAAGSEGKEESLPGLNNCWASPGSEPAGSLRNGQTRR